MRVHIGGNWKRERSWSAPREFCSEIGISEEDAYLAFAAPEPLEA
jgi:hypothetical protein